jgi:hypothetical protein
MNSTGAGQAQRLSGSSNLTLDVIRPETINNGCLCVIVEHTGSWMPITKGKPVCVARPISHVVPVPKHALWNAGVMMDFGNRTAWKFCLAQVIQDRRHLLALVNPMCALYDLPKMEISALMNAINRLTVNVLQNGTIFERLRFLNEYFCEN